MGGHCGTRPRHTPRPSRGWMPRQPTMPCWSLRTLSKRPVELRVISGCAKLLGGLQRVTLGVFARLVFFSNLHFAHALSKCVLRIFATRGAPLIVCTPEAPLE